MPRTSSIQSQSSPAGFPDMLQLLSRAMTAKAPIVGIPIQGSSPFCIRRELLIHALKGLRVIEAAIQMPLGRADGTPYLQTFGVTPFGGKNVTKFYPVHAPGKFSPMAPIDIKRALKDWAEKERDKRGIRKRCGLSPAPGKTKADRARVKYETHLVKLQKQLDKMPEYRPRHVLLRDPGEITSSERMRAENWARYRAEKPRRKLAMKLAREVMAPGGEKTVKDLYKLAREHGFAVRTVSELPKHEKDSLARESSSLVFPYLKRFWEFCGLTRPESNWNWKWDMTPLEFKADDLGPEHYKDWIENLHARQALVSEMDSVRGLLAGIGQLEVAADESREGEAENGK